MRRPATAGGGVCSRVAVSQRLSRAVEIRLFQISWTRKIASISLSTPSPVAPETGMTGAPFT